MKEKIKPKANEQNGTNVRGCLILFGFWLLVLIIGIMSLLNELQCLADDCRQTEYLMTHGAEEWLHETEALSTATAFAITISPIVQPINPLYWETPASND